jgi:inorganic pyrophosphatase
MNDYSSKYIGNVVDVEMDRPKGTKHPKWGFEYPVNYGCIPNTKAPDGGEIDAYVLGVEEPLNTFKGVCVAIIKRTDDDDDKLVVVPEGVDVSDDEIRKQTEFQEKYFKSEIIR